MNEGRRHWGEFVKRSGNLAVAALRYGSDDPDWRDRIVRRAAAFCPAARQSLLDDRTIEEPDRVLGRDEAERVVAAEHMPSAVAGLIGESLREGASGSASTASRSSGSTRTEPP